MSPASFWADERNICVVEIENCGGSLGRESKTKGLQFRNAIFERASMAIREIGALDRFHTLVFSLWNERRSDRRYADL